MNIQRPISSQGLEIRPDEIPTLLKYLKLTPKRRQRLIAGILNPNSDNNIQEADINILKKELDSISDTIELLRFIKFFAEALNEILRNRAFIGDSLFSEKIKKMTVVSCNRYFFQRIFEKKNFTMYQI